MRFEWDPAKDRRNRAKHKIGFDTARLVFDDPGGLTRLDRFLDHEDRWQTLGRVADELLMVVHAYRGVDDDMVIRIISASPYFSPRGERKCVRGPSVRGARRSARGSVLDSPLSTMNKRNDAMTGLSGAFAVRW